LPRCGFIAPCLSTKTQLPRATTPKQHTLIVRLSKRLPHHQSG
jgi:hypothetical protein